MKIGIAKEIGAGGKEHRAILLPREVKRLVEAGHHVYVEKGLGARIYVPDGEYRKTGARVISTRRHIFDKEIVVKLKPPLPQEFKMLKNNLLFSMLHAEQNPSFVKALKAAGAKAIAMEFVKNNAGERLISCSHMGGEQGMIMAFHMAEKTATDCNVLILGYGDISSGAIKVALSLGTRVKILRKSEYRYIKHFLRNKDIVVNGIRWPKEKRDRKEYLITRNMLALLSGGAVILDLSVDYPNPIETCHPTLLDSPCYTVDGVKHISIFGYPGLVPISSAKLYSKQIFPVLLKIASTGLNRLPKYLKKALVIP